MAAFKSSKYSEVRAFGIRNTIKSQLRKHRVILIDVSQSKR